MPIAFSMSTPPPSWAAITYAVSHRYTLTYTPSLDRILPVPPTLHVKIKNSSAIPLRAAYLHGPYALHVACHPSNFDPNRKHESPRQDGVPQYEPQLKAGGAWNATLSVPEPIRKFSETAESKAISTPVVKSATWIIEISSQIIFSSSAAVHFELLVGRDEKSLDLGFAKPAITGPASAGRVEDHQKGRERQQGRHPAQPKGVYSKAITLVVDDTMSLWSKPAFPEWKQHPRKQKALDASADPRDHHSTKEPVNSPSKDDRCSAHDHNDLHEEKQQRVHLVIVTHGLHSNTGADMLFLKESIDEAARQARKDARQRRAEMGKSEQAGRKGAEGSHTAKAPEDAPVVSRPDSTYQDHSNELPEQGSEDDTDDEHVIVRGYADNAMRTEKGIKYLGKRLAKYVLSLTHPQQPFFAVKHSAAQTITRSLTGHRNRSDDSGPASHPHSSIHESDSSTEKLPYKVTSISFIGHSLGGLTQTYAVAYIQKHAPHFFDEIEPINFIALATPFLGLSNENPLYVKFALDFGLVGRTGKDLGLTWRAPIIARGGWGAVVGGLGSAASKTTHDQNVPDSKPLLRILPTGPAHKALKRFRNRTVYSNVVNDGIVPLRTSCLLFLDWSGLGRVEKARRENGLVGTMAGWGWAELTGQNSSRRDHSLMSDEVASNEVVSRPDESDDEDGPHKGAEVPQPSESATKDDTVQGVPTPGLHGPEAVKRIDGRHSDDQGVEGASLQGSTSNPWDGFLSLFRSQPSQSPTRRPSQVQPTKTTRVYKRGQTINVSTSETTSEDDRAMEHQSTPETSVSNSKRPPIKSGEPAPEDSTSTIAPPKTTIFESAGDILNPPLPPTEFLINPGSRHRTIFHDRVYHPEDIPPAPPLRRRTGILRSNSTSESPIEEDHRDSGTASDDIGAMKVEEKIARAYHRDMAWRKVLVRLEPDAHNNMIVRRKFANAYGWPVVKHLVDTHFSDTHAARTRDDEESCVERAEDMDHGVGSLGEELKQVGSGDEVDHSRSDHRGARDASGDSNHSSMTDSSGSFSRRLPTRQDSGRWTDAAFDLTDDEEDGEGGGDHAHGGRQASHLGKIPILRDVVSSPPPMTPAGTDDAEIADFLRRPDSSEDKDSGTISGDMAQLGLRKSTDSTLGSPSSRGHDSDAHPSEHHSGRDGDGGVMQQVTRISSVSGRKP